MVGEYMLDVPDFRTDQTERIYDDIVEMTKRRFALARHLRDTRPWEFLMMVEMGTDRLHHGFWRFYDPKHPDYEPGTKWEQAFRDYYKLVDEEVGRLIEGLGDETAVMVVSDHGAQSMFGGIQINEWLMQNGYLRLVDPPQSRPRSARPRSTGRAPRCGRTAATTRGSSSTCAGASRRASIAPEDYEAIRSWTS